MSTSRRIRVAKAMTSPSQDKLQPISFQWALALTFVAWFAEVMLSTVLRPVLTRYGLQPMAAASLIRVLCFGGVFSVLLHQSGLTYRNLFHDSPSSVAATLGLLGLPILLLVPLIVLLDGIAMVWIEKLLPLSASEVTMFETMMGGGIGSWVLACAIAPLVEEMFFRGILLRGMIKRYAPADAMVYSAFVFGLVHLNIYQFLIAFAVGLMTASLYMRTRSLWPGIVLHAGINTMITVLTGYHLDAETSYPLWVWGLAAGCGLVGTVALRRFLWTPASRTAEAAQVSADAKGPQPPSDAA